ncbi:MAG: non-hydrolyzing UDP-N-acetylglucosamine 2-epimerase [Terriglobales bacterium]
MKLILVAGARPNFMKVAPLIKAIQASNARGQNHIEWRLVHTGQHYDSGMSEIFFADLGIPAPDFNLEVGSGSHATQTANIMKRFEPVLLNAFAPGSSQLSVVSGPSPDSTSHFSPITDQLPSASLPDWVVVVGDVNSTMACTLVAAKMGVRTAHVEAGLRSFDRTMPEEINRIVTDSLADLLLTPSEDANENLRREGIPEHKTRLVGNIMIDSLLAHLQSTNGEILERLGIADRSFIYVTLHRPSNVDRKESLAVIVEELNRVADEWPVVFPIHPRTRKQMKDFGLSFQPNTGLKLLDPIGYRDSIALTQHARCVLTDSGGLQEESTYFRTPCLTLRPNTERPITISVGSNRLTSATALRADLKRSLRCDERLGSVPPLWDGKTAERIIGEILKAVSDQKSEIRNQKSVDRY